MKRLVVCSDGLWNRTETSANSNIALLANAISPDAAGGVVQVTLADMLYGRDESVCALYQALAANYAPGDQIWLFGFSRGAYVVRSLAGMIRNVGLLGKHCSGKLAEAWHIYRTRWGADAHNAVKFRDGYCHQPTIKFLGAWETVGDNGIPGAADGFHDRRLSNCVENAYHALAIDEASQGLAPCLWRTGAERSRTEQCWFSGTHRDMGGMGQNMAFANASLAWMAERATSLGLELDRGFLSAAMAARTGNGIHDNEYRNGRARRNAGRRTIGVTNQDETVHPSAEQLYLRNPGYRPANLKHYLGRDEQIQLPL
ncbi:MAG: DUF2235 domain-containing protein [Porticoccaceae bacterium]